MRNNDIRQKLDTVKSVFGIHRYDVAYALGINDSSFSRWLRRELPEAKKQLVMATIETLIKERNDASK